MTEKRYRIAVVTGTRAEYGLLYWLMKEIDGSDNLELQLIVTGAHLSPEFGMTVNDIEKDGFNISWKVEMLLSSDSSVAITKSLGLAIMGFADAFAHLKPDIVILLGDRYEILGAAEAAFIAHIPIAHLHGGETTLGAYDNAFRHSITQMSALHFVAREEYRDKVISLGADPKNVFVTGPMCLDAMARMQFPTQSELEDDLGIVFNHPLFIVTYHPETLSKLPVLKQISEVLDALAKFDDATIVFTGANADTDGRVINQKIKEFCAIMPTKRIFRLSLGMRRYWGLLKLADVVIGNSSSGILEAPLFGVQVLNIGDRQKGRLANTKILNATCCSTPIYASICHLGCEAKKHINRALTVEEAPSKLIIAQLLEYLTTNRKKENGNKQL